MKYLKLNIKDDGLNTRKTFQQAQNSKQQNLKKICASRTLACAINYEVIT